MNSELGINTQHTRAGFSTLLILFLLSSILCCSAEGKILPTLTSGHAHTQVSSPNPGHTSPDTQLLPGEQEGFRQSCTENSSPQTIQIIAPSLQNTCVILGTFHNHAVP